VSTCARSESADKCLNTNMKLYRWQLPCKTALDVKSVWWFVVDIWHSLARTTWHAAKKQGKGRQRWGRWWFPTLPGVPIAIRFGTWVSDTSGAWWALQFEAAENSWAKSLWKMLQNDEQIGHDWRCDPNSWCSEIAECRFTWDVK